MNKVVAPTLLSMRVAYWFVRDLRFSQQNDAFSWTVLTEVSNGCNTLSSGQAFQQESSWTVDPLTV
jgi:hypothetical protein